MARVILNAVLYPAYIYMKWRVSYIQLQLNDFLAMEAQVHLKLAKQSKKTCGYLNPRESPNRQNALIFNFYWRLSHMHDMHAEK